MALVIFAFTACQNENSETPKASATLTSPVDASWSAFNARDFDGVRATYATDAMHVEPGAGVVIEGVDEIVLGYHEAWVAALSDVQIEPQATWFDGANATAIVWIHGTQDGPLTLSFGEIPSTNATIGVLAIQHLELNADGKIVTEAWIVDEPAIVTQLGLAEGPARPVMETAWTERPDVVATGDALEADNAAMHVFVYEQFSDHDPAMFDSFADDIVESNPSSPEDVVGTEDLQAFNEALWAGFSDVGVEVQSSWGAGDWSILQGRLVGTNDGPCPPFGVDDSGLTIDVSFIEAVEWNDGKAVTSRPFMNSAQLAAQLGLM